jgi:1,2-dihydroxy-3-keto-5-methylthiopentene dioxygenase
MSALTIYSDNCPDDCLFETYDQSIIRQELSQVGIRFEQWPTDPSIAQHSASDEILKAYDNEIKRLVEECGYQSWDVVSLHPAHPQKDALRQKFLSEHTHNEDEVRFFVSGKGLFTLHIDSKVYCVLLERGDLISVPAKVLHWFDMGPEPDFIAIRLFNNPEGWLAQYSGNDIGDRFPKIA